jgi:hypothetical protein
MGGARHEQGQKKPKSRPDGQKKACPAQAITGRCIFPVGPLQNQKLSLYSANRQLLVTSLLGLYVPVGFPLK